MNFYAFGNVKNMMGYSIQRKQIMNYLKSQKLQFNLISDADRDNTVGMSEAKGIKKFRAYFEIQENRMKQGFDH